MRTCMADPNSEAPAATRPSPTEIPPSVVTEVGCQSPYRRRRRSATARGRFLEMQKWAEVAEKSGSREWARSMPSNAFRTGEKKPWNANFFEANGGAAAR